VDPAASISRHDPSDGRIFERHPSLRSGEAEFALTRELLINSRPT